MKTMTCMQNERMECVMDCMTENMTMKDMMAHMKTALQKMQRVCADCTMTCHMEMDASAC